MAERATPTDEALVVHVIPNAVGRGAQREARLLVDHLGVPGQRRHQLWSVFDGPADVGVDRALGCRPRRGPASKLDPTPVHRLRSALAQARPAAVVAHGGEPLKYLVPATWGRRTPVVYYAIGTYAGSRGAPQLALWRWLIDQAHAVAAVGDEVRDELRSLFGVDPDRVVVTANGRDPDLFRPAAADDEADRDDRRPVVGFVGALTAQKQPDRFIAVVAELRRRGLRFDAVLVGGGPLHDALAGPARVARVGLLGPRSDVPSLLRQLDVLVFPSRPAGEGLPGILIEAGLSGVPVVATPVPGVADIVVDGRTGVVVADDEIDTLAGATAALLDSPAARARMGRDARRRCSEVHTVDASVRRWDRVLTRLVGGTGKGGTGGGGSTRDGGGTGAQ